MNTQTKVGIVISNLSALIFLLAFISSALPLFIMGGLVMAAGGGIAFNGNYKNNIAMVGGKRNKSNLLELEQVAYYDHITDSIVEEYKPLDFETTSFQDELLKHAREKEQAKRTAAENAAVAAAEAKEAKEQETRQVDVFVKEDIFSDSVAAGTVEKPKMVILDESGKKMSDRKVKKLDIDTQTFAENIVIVEEVPEKPKPKVHQVDKQLYFHDYPFVDTVQKNLPKLDEGLFWILETEVVSKNIMKYSEYVFAEMESDWKFERDQNLRAGYINHYLWDRKPENSVVKPKGHIYLKVTLVNADYESLKESHEFRISHFKHGSLFNFQEARSISPEMKEISKEESDKLLKEIMWKAKHMKETYLMEQEKAFESELRVIKSEETTEHTWDSRYGDYINVVNRNRSISQKEL